MFAKENFYQAEPDLVVAIMTQLSPKAGLKQWINQTHAAGKSKMK